jgi:hypothetical protein
MKPTGKVHIVENLSDVFLIQNGLKQDVLSPLLENQEGLV